MTRRPRSTATAIVASSLLVAACQGSSPGTPGDASPPTDGGHDAARDAKETARDAREDAHDAAVDAPPVRVAATRGLLPTSVENLLLDPFVTYDESWGHFVLVDPATGIKCLPLVRELMSQSPIGISGAVAKVSLQGTCTQVLAPMPGASTGSVQAEMWISLSDSSGNPLPFPSAAELDLAIKVELVPNYLAAQMPQDVYPLAPVTVSPISPAAGTLPTVIAGREWGLVALTATPFAQGGWLVITMVSTTGSFYLAGPEVVPTEVVPLVLPRSRAMTNADRRATTSYERAVRVRSTPRRTFGAH